MVKQVEERKQPCESAFFPTVTEIRVISNRTLGRFIKTFLVLPSLTTGVAKSTRTEIFKDYKNTRSSYLYQNN